MRATGILRLMEYQVPQFIEVEDHIVGPLTLKQFIYVAGGGGACVALLVYLPLLLAVPFSILIGGFTLALSFYRVNGKPFIDVLEAGFNYYTGAKLFLWKHQDAVVNAPQKVVPGPERRQHVARLTRGKLSDLAWSLDVNTGRATDDLES